MRELAGNRRNPAFPRAGAGAGVGMAQKRRFLAAGAGNPQNSRATSLSLYAPGLEEFTKSGPLNSFLHSLADWVEEHGGAHVEGGPLPLAIIPNFSNNKHPLIPPGTDIARLSEIQKVWREYVKHLWRYDGGCPTVPWSLIQQDLDKWINPKRRPPNAVWKDPGSSRVADLLVWVEYVIDGQAGKLPADQILQFRCVVAAPETLDSAESEATSREEVVSVRDDGQKTKALHLLFDNGITRCQVPGGMSYSQESLANAHNIAVRLAKARAPEVAPEEWLGLPVAGPNHPRVVIDGDEKDAILATAVRLPSEAEERVETFMDVINNHESHIPALVPQGVWACAKKPPNFVPASPPDAPLPHIFKTVWLSSEFFKDWVDVAGPEFTIEYALKWVAMFLTHEFIRHQPSGMLLGGEHGVVWLFRILVKLLFNIAAMRGSLQSPDPLPAGYDSKTLPFERLWHDVLAAINSCIDAVEASTKILTQTSGDQEVGLAFDSLVPSAAEANTSNPPSPLPNKRRKGKATESKPRKRSKNAELSRAAADQSDEDKAVLSKSEPESEEEDYGRLDGGSAVGANDEEEEEFESLGEGILDMDEIRREDGSARAPNSSTSTAAKVWTPDDRAFGRHPPLPKFIPLELKTVADVINALTGTCKSVFRLFADWSRWESDYSVLCEGDLKNGTRTAANSKYPENLRPLYEYIFQRQLAWRRAKAAAPEVHEFRSTWARRQNEGPRFLELMECVTASKSLLVELRLKYFELDALNCCALFWHNKLEADWLEDDPTGDPVLLRKLVQGQLDWKQGLPRVFKGIGTRRKKLKLAIGMPDLESKTPTHTVQYFLVIPRSPKSPLGFTELDALKHLENVSLRNPSADSDLSPRQKDTAAPNAETHKSTATKTTGKAAPTPTSPSALATPARQHPKPTPDTPAASAAAEPVASNPPVLPAPKSRKKRWHEESAPSESTARRVSARLQPPAQDETLDETPAKRPGTRSKAVAEKPKTGVKAAKKRVSRK
ncbi:hypothetical protein FRC09_019150 [Ceratobasidium sp. 395]|nr:hypothetical protein FRC09_019150 [Ceratobasidium sp. 395]